MGAILSMAYASTVVSFLTARKLNPIANSIEYFANNPDKELVMIKEYQLTEYILVRFILFRCFWFLIFCFLLSYQQSNIQFVIDLTTECQIGASKSTGRHIPKKATLAAASTESRCCFRTCSQWRSISRSKIAIENRIEAIGYQN